MIVLIDLTSTFLHFLSTPLTLVSQAQCYFIFLFSSTSGRIEVLREPLARLVLVYLASQNQESCSTISESRDGSTTGTSTNESV